MTRVLGKFHQNEEARKIHCNYIVHIEIAKYEFTNPNSGRRITQIRLVIIGFIFFYPWFYTWAFSVYMDMRWVLIFGSLSCAYSGYEVTGFTRFNHVFTQTPYQITQHKDSSNLDYAIITRQHSKIRMVLTLNRRLDISLIKCLYFRFQIEFFRMFRF